jgi:hypothetical protein
MEIGERNRRAAGTSPRAVPEFRRCENPGLGVSAVVVRAGPGRGTIVVMTRRSGRIATAVALLFSVTVVAGSTAAGAIDVPLGRPAMSRAVALARVTIDFRALE